jgi:hypothetical protein
MMVKQIKMLAYGLARFGSHRLRLSFKGKPVIGRVGAVLQMNVGDYVSQGRRGWVRLHEKGGKEHEAPCVPKLEAYLDAYIAAAGIAGDKEPPEPLR